MKLKVLFILPVLVFNAIWWAPLAMANNPSGGGDQQYDNSAKNQQIADLKKQIATMQIVVDDLDSELNLKENELILAKTAADNAYKANPTGKIYMSAASKLIDAINAKDAAQAAFAPKKAELDAKKKELDDLQKQTPTGSNDQGISNSQGGGTILPGTAYDLIADCEAIMRYVNSHPEEIEKAIAERKGEISGPSSVQYNYNPSYTDIMGCAIKTGDVKFWMIPYFARYILEFIIGIAGLASVAGIIYGGYLYLFAGLSDDQQKGKSAIKNSIIALVLSLSAWAIVNIVISLVTGI